LIQNLRNIKSKGKVVPVHSMKIYSMSGGMAELIQASFPFDG